MATPKTQELTIGKTYRITATPNDTKEYRCKDIMVNTAEIKDFGEKDGIGTCTFTMTNEVSSINASFVKISDGKSVEIGVDEYGTSSDGLGIINVEEDK